MSSFVQRCLVILAGFVLPSAVYAMPCPTPSVPNVEVDASAFLFAKDCSEIERGSLLPSGVSGQILLKRKGSVTWVVNVVDPDNTPLLPYRIEFGYALKAGQRLLDVFVNGVLVKPKLEFLNSGSTVLRRFTDPLIVNLRPGHNRIQLAATGQRSPFLETFNLSPVRYINRGENVAARPDPFTPDCQRTGPGTFDFEADPGYFDSYYGKVDPLCQRSTLHDWQKVNNFLDFPHLVVHAEYINAYDLGFGRDMNCLDNGRTSCYVANHQEPKGSNKLVATVAMERMPFSSRTITAFFVYDELGRRLNQIKLDGEGAKSVPESCYACHKGYTSAGGNPVGGEYLPFDIDAFEDWPGKLPRANQASAFRELNKIIHRYASQNDQNTDIADLIESWYDGNVASGSYQAFRDFFDCNPSPNKLPKADWFTNKYKSFCDVPSDFNAINTYVREWNLYQFGYAKYCRLCHVAQVGLAQTGFLEPVGNWPQRIVGETVAGFKVWADKHVCDIARPRMPHAELTDERVRTDAFPNGTEPLRPYNLICNP